MQSSTAELASVLSKATSPGVSGRQPANDTVRMGAQASLRAASALMAAALCVLCMYGNAM